MSESILGHRHNPFATKYVRAGRLSYVFPPNCSPTTIVDRLRASQWRGQIVGPHGSGKSTLLRSLTTNWPNSAPKACRVRVGRKSHLYRSIRSGALLFLDGFERLNLVQQIQFVLQCRVSKCGFLVTSHRPIWTVDVVWRTSTSLDLAKQLVAALAPDQSRQLAISCYFTQSEGNLREMFMRLYDDYQAA